ncbi:MAG: DegV family protein [Clostridiales bacterium]
MKIKITADSTCDLSPALIEKYNVAITPLSVQIGESSLKDGKDITAQEVVDAFEKQNILAKTAAVSIGEYLEIFKKYTEEGYNIIHINIGSNFSACHQNATLAAKEIGNVTVVDSQNLSTGQGHIVVKAAELAAMGKNSQEIEQELNELIPRIDASFLLDTLTYMHKGGRCSTVTTLGANLLQLKPCIEVKNGKMSVGKKYRGELGKCYKQYIKDRLNNIEEFEDHLVFISHSPQEEDILPIAQKSVESYNYFKNIESTKAGCTITSHCGPKTLGVLCVRKK